jgi:4-carboxymuconolactone decarboxylase
MLALILATSIACPEQILAQQGARDAKEPRAATVPKDVYPDSGFRLPLPKRYELDDLGKKMYDEYATPGGQSLAGLRGPGGIRLYSPEEAQQESIHNHYLRYDAGFEPRIRELAILVSAREAESQFEWTAHETVARREGLDQPIISVVKYRRSTAGLPDQEAVIIELGRQMFGQKKVNSETFARALRIFGPRGLVNLVSLMGDYMATAALLTAFDMQLPPGQEPTLPVREQR